MCFRPLFKASTASQVWFWNCAKTPVNIITLPVNLISPCVSSCRAEGLCLHFIAPRPAVPLGCAGASGIAERQPSATGLRTQPWLLSPLYSSLLPAPWGCSYAPPQLTYLAVSLLIQKTSKQMRSSPVRRCRPAARASGRATPRTWWLCTFPGQKANEEGKNDETFSHA